MQQQTYNGLTDAEWVNLLDETEWREEIRVALYAIAACKDARPEIRSLALALLNEAIVYGILPMQSWLPRFTRDVFLNMVTGAGRRKWWILRERLNRNLYERIAGLQATIHTFRQFMVPYTRRMAELDENAEMTS